MGVLGDVIILLMLICLRGCNDRFKVVLEWEGFGVRVDEERDDRV